MSISLPKRMNYDNAKALARSDDPAVRRTLAARRDIEPEILYFLAEDGEPEVREAIAANEETPRLADLLLARDTEVAVRRGLAGKIAKLAPGLTDREQDKARQLTYEVLETLARDRAATVRRVLAEALKDVADAPPAIIGRLARDLELVVCGPVLEQSPVLSDDDILDIIAGDPVLGALSAISRRPTVSGPVAAAIAASDDAEAIAELLANPKAQIQEETLDSILDRAPKRKRWHAPLVRRPKLGKDAATRLALFVADNLIDMLTKRKDLPQDTLEGVRAVVKERIDRGELAAPEETKAETKAETPEEAAVDAETPEDADSAGDDEDDVDDDPAMQRARELHEAGKLTPKAVGKAVKKGDDDFVAAALATLTGAHFAQVKRLVATAEAKALVCLAWKAELPMATAVEIQRDLAKVPTSRLMSADAGGGYPMSEDDMLWQLDLLGIE